MKYSSKPVYFYEDFDIISLSANKWNLSNMNDLMDDHVTDYYDYLSAMDWRESCEAMNAAEGRWLDNGGYHNAGFGY